MNVWVHDSMSAKKLKNNSVKHSLDTSNQAASCILHNLVHEQCVYVCMCVCVCRPPLCVESSRCCANTHTHTHTYIQDVYSAEQYIASHVFSYSSSPYWIRSVCISLPRISSVLFPFLGSPLFTSSLGLLFPLSI